MAATYCPNCGTARTGSFRFCPSCGLDLDAVSATMAGPGPLPSVTADMTREQYARTLKARQSLGIVTRAFGCLGIVGGVIVGALVGAAIGGAGSMIEVVLALIVGPIVGAFVGSRLGLDWWAGRG